MSPLSSASKNKPSKKPAKTGSKQRFLGVLIPPRHVPPKRRLAFNGLHDISQKIEGLKEPFIIFDGTIPDVMVMGHAC
jgi:hypothetical protein